MSAPDLKALLAAYDQAQAEDSARGEKRAEVDRDVSAIGATGKMANVFTAVGMMSDKQMCKVCGQMVTLMSKCPMKPYMYHCDLV